MRYFYLLCLSLFSVLSAFSQTKVSGVVNDESGNPVPFANVIFANSSVGTITNDDGSFYLESEETYKAINISFVGFKSQVLELTKSATYDIEIILEEEASALDEVVIYQGKTSKKNNPAIDILRKIWENKRENGIYKFDQYQYKKYEK